VIDQDVQVLGRKTVRVKAFRLAGALQQLGSIPP
jgi:hypothetical protein